MISDFDWTKIKENNILHGLKLNFVHFIKRKIVTLNFKEMENK